MSTATATESATVSPPSPTVAPTTAVVQTLRQRFVDRNELLDQIADLESKLFVLRERLPECYKIFFVFYTDKRRIWVYAETREQAVKQLEQRMNQDYGAGGWKLTSSAVLQYVDPTHAATNSPGSLLQSLSRDDALSFIQDFRDNQRGRVPRSKDMPKSQLEQDVENYERSLRNSRG